ncbi:MAG: histidyl-tRNA synthetase [Flavobacteriales bacterium]
MKKLQAIKGMNDLLPDDAPLWQYFEAKVTDLLQSYAYREIRTPLLEQTELFARGIGEATDIVEKEMYTFTDRNGDSLTLRPEGTASCVRACEQHQMLFNRGILTQKLWYRGPMFRHEKPQKGRLRQFHQFGVEAFGYTGPDIDAELLILTHRLWKSLGISEAVELQINSLGSADERIEHKKALVVFLESIKDELDDDSQRRLYKNPLRVFDSKDKKTQSLLSGAPELKDFLGEESIAHFEGLKILLDSVGVPYVINPRLVRGLDYYNQTVFEWVTSKLGSQGTICGGGRYDGLVTQLGGHASPAVGFGLGVERLILLLRELNVVPMEITQTLDVYIVALAQVQIQATQFSERLRDELPNLRIQLHSGGGSFRSQMKKADKSGASIALILGESEIENSEVGVKFLRQEREQETLKQQELYSILQQEC